MLKKISLKKILLGLLVIFVIMQLFRIDKNNPSSDPKKKFVVMTKASPEIENLLVNACYDCHSNKATYPWYSNIAPVSWWLKHHVNEGREHLNFSEWGKYTPKKADHKLEECVEMLEEGEMPLGSYSLIHSEAKLTEQEKLSLINWFNTLMTSEVDAQ